MSFVPLLAATTFGIGAAFGQAKSDVTIHISPRQTCLVGSLDVPCSAALTSLRDAGFRLKLGYSNQSHREK